MFKKGLFFGVLGFLISFVSINLTSTDKEITSQESSSMTYEDGINGWISFGNILQENIKEAFLNEDDFFVSMFMMKAMERIPDRPEIIITGEDNSIFWTNGSAEKGTKYTGWEQKRNSNNFLISESLSKVRIDILSNDRTVAGHLYLVIQIRTGPKEFDIQGWRNYGLVLASSNTIRGYVSEKNGAGIKSFIDKVTRKEDILNLTFLSANGTAIWDINNANSGWIREEKDKNEPDRFYLSFPVEYEERKIADIHFLVKFPMEKGSSFFGNSIARIRSIFNATYLMIAFISFLILFVAGGVLNKSAPAQGAKVIKGAGKGTPGLENKIQSLKEEIEDLENTKAEVMEEVAKKQKVQKDLENEIGLLEKKKETVSVQTEVEGGVEEAEEEGSEEDLLFDNLLGEKGKTSAKKKEELEVTQRIVAKRREEINLSGKIETRRKELLELERKIDNLKKK